MSLQIPDDCGYAIGVQRGDIENIHIPLSVLPLLNVIKHKSFNTQYIVFNLTVKTSILANKIMVSLYGRH